jgi:hypothetical protein
LYKLRQVLRHRLEQQFGVHGPQTRPDPALGLSLPVCQPPVATPGMRHDHKIAW